MRYFREGNNPNLIVGVFLLVALALFAGPDFLPRIASSIVPAIDEGMPCAWLRSASERDRHQSLLGRAAANPIRLSVRTSALPAPDGVLSITITVTNASLGTVPFLFNPNQVIVGDVPNTSGLGVIFSPPSSLTTGGVRQALTTFSEADIKLLGPRQRCVVRLEFPGGNVLIDPAVSSGTGRVRAYYRVTTRGAVIPPANTLATPIYPDQGLWVGYVESPEVVIPPRT
jgi:hypothetical protein